MRICKDMMHQKARISTKIAAFKLRACNQIRFARQTRATEEEALMSGYSPNTVSGYSLLFLF